MFPEGPAHSIAPPRIGQILTAKYELLRLLGEGGMAFVYEATHLRLKQRVAIKLLVPEMARDPELRARFEHEARAVAKLRTPHVARVMDVDTTNDGLPFIVMEFLEGRDLEGELAARQRLPVEEAVDYILQACAAMMEAHDTGIVHRDLKPANLFLVREGQDRIVKVLDFGISKVLGEGTRLTGAGAVMGTVLYMSPEQIRASKDVDQRADIWSLGVILFELIAGRPPWEGSSHQIAIAIMGKAAPDIRTFAQVPEGLAQIIANMLQRDASKRIGSVMELVLALGPYARADSLGGVIAGQIALGSTGAKMRALSGREGREGRAVKSMTMPMMQGPPKIPPQPALPVIMTPPQGYGGTAPPATHPTAAPAMAQPTRRTLVIIGIMLGLAGAAGLTLIAVWYVRRAHPRAPPDRPRVADTDTPPISASAPSASTPRVEPPEAADTATAAPPPTGTATATTRRPGSKTSPSAPRSSAPAPSPAASDAPKFL